MFGEAIAAGRAARPFAIEVNLGAYWLTRLKSKRATPAMQAFEAWICAAATSG